MHQEASGRATADEVDFADPVRPMQAPDAGRELFGENSSGRCVRSSTDGRTPIQETS